MKNVTILYDSRVSEQKALARDIDAALNDDEYEVTLKGVSSFDEMSRFLVETTPETCQILININLTGYDSETTGGCAAINRLPMNLVNVITKPFSECEATLEKPQSYMAWFVFTDESAADAARKRFSHLWHVEWCADMAEVSILVGEMELRYKEKCLQTPFFGLK